VTMAERSDPSIGPNDPSVERSDPGRAGVKAGRLVGVLTAAITVASLVRTRGSFYGGMTLLVEFSGLDPVLPVSVLFWGTALFAAVARYGIGYVVGSLVGVLYDFLDRPPWPVLAAVVFAIGFCDGALAVLDTRSVAVGSAYVLAWLCYVPAFLLIVDDDTNGPTGPRRLG